MRIALTRALVSLFWLATALYALLSTIPFASKQFIGPQLVPAIAAFAAWHSWLSVAVLFMAVFGLSPWLLAGHRGARAFAACWAAVALLTFGTGGLATLEPSNVALVVTIGALLPAVWLALLDLPGRRDSPAQDAGSPADFMACAAAALVVTATHATLTVWAAGAVLTTGWVVALGRSVMLHLVVFSAIFGGISIIRGAARLLPSAETAEAWLARGALAAVYAVFMYRIVLASLSFTGAPGMTVAAAFGVALAVVLAPRGTHAPAGLASAVGGFVPRWAAASPILAGVWLVLAMSLVAGAETAMSGSDWNFTIAKLIALTAWLIALATMLRVVPGFGWHPAQRRIVTLAPFVACVLVLGIQQVAWSGVSAESEGDTGSAATRGDISTRLIVDALAPPAPAQAGLYGYLQRNTNIPHSVRVEPVNIDFASIAGPSSRRPHVFMFVVDSLRRDYLSPYNEDVSFTPALGRFAAESTVFERAFTRYGATGLSVPSIWTGGLVLHKQYVTPFGPMNTLAKLLDAEGYAQWISMNHIMDSILPPGAARDPLDATLPVKDQRFCLTLQDLRSRLDRLTPSAPATFAYALPQDLHISAITREGSQPVDDREYDGFNAAYASRVRRLDACFGEFVDDLKARGLYDDSVIILTSDHGDSLGEQGRMGHAYTIYPEIVQIPLLVHLPEALRSIFTADVAAAAFTSDLTPSLYALLGHEPMRPSVIFGQPLFRQRGSTVSVKRETAEVVASSYGSVYGALLDDARRLYIIDAISLREYVYALDGTAAGRSMQVRPADREEGQRAIRATIDEIATFYKFKTQ